MSEDNNNGSPQDPVPLVDCGSRGPIRCHRCKAYINAFAIFVAGGRQYTCSLCAFVNQGTMTITSYKDLYLAYEEGNRITTG